MKYCYPAIFRKDLDDEENINVVFPDLMGVVTCGKGEEEALFMAKDVLKTMLQFDYIRNTKPTSKEETQKNFKDEKIVMVEVEYNG